MATIEIDLHYYLDQVRTDDLLRELQRREVEAPFATLDETIGDLRQAFYARDASRFEMVLRRMERARAEAANAI